MKPNRLLEKMYFDIIKSSYLQNEDLNKKMHYEGKRLLIEPIISLTPEQEKVLTKGLGQIKNPEEYKQINSSTGLAVNYYKILEKTGNLAELRFEDQVGKPLRNGFPANLDVSYTYNDKQYYVESKFLEPYYNFYKSNESNTSSYFIRSRYKSELPYIDKWIDLFYKAEQFNIYNVAQLCRHLLAIYVRYMKAKDKTIVLESVTWRMTSEFLNMIENEEIRDLMVIRINDLYKESRNCLELLNDFLQNKIHCDNISFETLCYNDILEDISQSDKLNEFKLRYFLE